MTDSQVEEVKSKVDIVSLIGEYLELKKAGRNYKANCPFHGEKTPSFMVSPELQIFKCFGCGASGDVFTFLERHEGMDFGEALKYLAEKVGVKLKSFKKEDISIKEKITEINNSALNLYQYALTSHKIGQKALGYLIKQRGLDKKNIKEFKIGYSPDDPKIFIDYLIKKKKFKIEDLIASGLILKGKYGFFDRFSGRIIFPLFDHRDNCLGFAGRVLPWDKRDTGKYINSPETPAYHKSKMLFGLNLSKKTIREKNYVIVVEGELDMISVFAHGIKNVVAIKGSSLTEDQIRLLSRFCSRMILCLDSDFAGDEATQKGAVLAVDLGFEVKVAKLTKYKDPDEAIQKDPNGFKDTLKKALNIWDFLIEEIFAKSDPDTGEGKSKISKKIIPILALIKDEIVRMHYVEMVSKKLSVPVDAVLEELGKRYISSTKKDDDLLIAPKIKNRKALLENKFISISVSKNIKFLFDNDNYKLISTPFNLKIIDKIHEFSQKQKSFKILEFVDNLPQELKQGFLDLTLQNGEDEDVNLVIKELKILSLKEDMAKISNSIKEAEKEDDQKKIVSMQTKFNQTAKILAKLEEEI